MNFKLRPATQEDYTYYYHLTKRNMYNYICQYWGKWVASECRAGFDVKTVSIITVDDQPIGYLNVKDRGNELHIDNLQLTQRYQGKGIGYKILKDLLTKYQNRNFGLTVFENNPARNLYARLGFREVENDSGAIRMVKEI